MDNELRHYGIAKQRWGVRRFQNYDGTLTPAGRERYLGERKNKTVFVSGSSKTQDKKSGYYLKRLPYSVRSELKEHMKRGDKIIVGDAPGIDRQTQDYLAKKNYTNVEVFSPGKEGARYLANPGWKQTNVDKKGAEIGSKEWLAAKDLVMSKLADKGIAVTLDQGAKATRKNVDRLIAANKDVMVYELAKREGGFIRRAFANATDVERRFEKGREIDPDYYDEPVHSKSSGSKSWVEEAANDPKHWRQIESASGERLYERIEPSKSSGRYTTGSKETPDQMFKRLESDPGYIKVKDKSKSGDGGQALVKIEDKATAAVSLSYLGYSDNEIAEILGVSVESLRKTK